MNKWVLLVTVSVASTLPVVTMAENEGNNAQTLSEEQRRELKTYEKKEQAQEEIKQREELRKLEEEQNREETRKMLDLEEQYKYEQEQKARKEWQQPKAGGQQSGKKH